MRRDPCNEGEGIIQVDRPGYFHLQRAWPQVSTGLRCLVRPTASAEVGDRGPTSRSRYGAIVGDFGNVGGYGAGVSPGSQGWSGRGGRERVSCSPHPRAHVRPSRKQPGVGETEVKGEQGRGSCVCSDPLRNRHHARVRCQGSDRGQPL